MNKTVVGVFHDLAEAQEVVAELLKQGVPRSEISIVAGKSGPAQSGLLEDMKPVTLPDGGQVLAAGPLGMALTDKSVGALAGMGISPEMARAYLEAVRGSKVLVAARTGEDRLRAMGELMHRYRTADVTQGRTLEGQGEVILPVVQEELQVGKREVQRGGVHVFSHVTERPVEESVRLREEHVTVERHPVNRPVAPGDATAFKEGTFEVRQSAEEAVVNKEVRVIEEVVIGKKVTERTETVRDTVRRTEVDVQEMKGQGQKDPYAAHEQDFRKNYSTAFSKSGYNYDQVAPAYRFGSSLVGSDQYRGKDWKAIEKEAQSHWEERNPGTWERFKEAVRYSWERVQAAVGGTDTSPKG